MSLEGKPEIKQEEDQPLPTRLPPSVQQIALDYLGSYIDVKSIPTPYPYIGLKLFNVEQDILKIIANRFILRGDKHNDLYILLSKYPYILDNNKAIIDILFPGINQTTLNSLADYYVLWGCEPEHLKRLIQNYPDLLNKITEAQDPAGRKIKGTLYQKALGAGDFEMAEMLKEFLTPDEEEKQYAQQFPKNWKKEANKKLVADMNALDQVWKALRDAKEVDYVALRKECQPAIDAFKKYLHTAVKPTGYHFDLQLLVKAAMKVKLDIQDLYGSDTVKENIFFESIFGSLQLSVSARDMHELMRMNQLMPRDLDEFDKLGPAPRTLRFKDHSTPRKKYAYDKFFKDFISFKGLCFEDSPMNQFNNDTSVYSRDSQQRCIGDNAFIGITGVLEFYTTRVQVKELGYDEWMRRFFYRSFTNLMLNKNKRAEQFLNNRKKNSCTIM